MDVKELTERLLLAEGFLQEKFSDYKERLASFSEKKETEKSQEKAKELELSTKLESQRHVYGYSASFAESSMQHSHPTTSRRLDAAVFSSIKEAPTTRSNSQRPPSSGSWKEKEEDYEEIRHEADFLRAQLLQTVDGRYNVIDMPLMLDVLGKLEHLIVTKEMLEQTQLGITVNKFRRKVNNAVISRRLKELVKEWRDKVIPLHYIHTMTSSVGSAECGPSTVPVGLQNFLSGEDSNYEADMSE